MGHGIVFTPGNDLTVVLLCCSLVELLALSVVVFAQLFLHRPRTKNAGVTRRDQELRCPHALSRVLIATLLGTLLITAISARRDYMRGKEVFTALEERVAKWEKSGFSRPVLRGTPVPGNAARAHFGAIVRMGKLPGKSIVAADDSIKAGTPPADLVALATSKTEELAALRLATQSTYAWSPPDLREGIETAIPAYGNSLLAVRLLLVEASQASGRVCLQIAADSLRMMWDIAPSGQLTGHVAAGKAVRMVLPFAATCLNRVESRDLVAAASEFREVLRHASPMGQACYASSLCAAEDVAHAAGDFILLPRSIDQLRSMRERPSYIEHLKMLLEEEVDLFKEITPDQHPDALKGVASRIASQPKRKRRFLQGPMLESCQRLVKVDQEAQALMRAMVVGLASLASPPSDLLQESELRDPFTGRSLVRRAATKAVPLAVYSVGADGEDNGLAAGSDDVGLSFASTSPAAE